MNIAEVTAIWNSSKCS